MTAMRYEYGQCAECGAAVDKAGGCFVCWRRGIREMTRIRLPSETPASTQRDDAKEGEKPEPTLF